MVDPVILLQITNYGSTNHLIIEKISLRIGYIMAGCDEFEFLKGLYSRTHTHTLVYEHTHAPTHTTQYIYIYTYLNNCLSR